MSRGSTLTLFVDNKIGGLTNGLHDMYIENHKDDFPVEVKTHPRFYDKYAVFGECRHSGDCPVAWDMIDSETGKTYTRVLEFQFGSIFNSLIEDMNLNSYDPSNSSKIIDSGMADDMVKAIDYLLLKKYDSDIEEVMNNRYIEIFGTMLKDYNEYKYHLMFPNDSEYVAENEDNKYVLINFRTALRAFLDTENNENLILMYESWG